MKKFAKSILVGFILIAVGLVTVGCGCSKEVAVESITFDEPYIELLVGDVYTLKPIVLPENATNKGVTYSDDYTEEIGDDYPILWKKGGKVSGENSGVAMITAIARTNTRLKAFLEVRVFEKQVTLDTPVGVAYENGKIVWKPVKYSLAGKSLSPEGYIVNLNGVDQPMQTNCEFTNFEVGRENKVKVKAVGSGIALLDSEYSTEVTFTVLNAPNNLVREGLNIKWDAVENAVSYRVMVDDKVYASDITDTSFELDFAKAGKYGVSVIAVPNTSSTTIYPSFKSNVLSIIKLDSIKDLTIENSVMKWNEVIQASEYNVIFKQEEKDDIVISSGINAYLDLLSLGNKLPSGEYTAYVKAVSNNTSGIDSETPVSINFEKLGTPNNLQVVDNKLCWSLSPTAVSYEIMVNGGEVLCLTGTDYSLPEGSPAGEYTFKLHAVGNGTTVISSDWTSDENIYKAIKLAAPTSVTHLQNVITVNEVSGAVGYKVMDTLANASEYGNISKFTTKDGNVSFEMHFPDKVTDINALLNNRFSIKVKALGAVSDEPEVERSSNTFDSDYSEVSTEFYKMLPPINFEFDEDTQSWGWKNNVNWLVNQYGEWYGEGEARTLVALFKIYNDYETFVVKRIDAPGSGLTQQDYDAIKAGELKIAVAACANGVEMINSDYTAPILTRKMYEPIDLTVVGDKLTWKTEREDVNAKFTLAIKGEESNTVLGNVTNPTKEFTLSEETFVFGNEYTILIQSAGENVQFPSKISQIKLSRLQAPEITATKGKINWSAVTNATGYKVYANDELAIGELVDNEDGTFSFVYELDAAGEYKFKVVAIGDKENEQNTYIQSVASNEITITKLGVDTLSIQNNNLSWNSNYTENVIYLVVVMAKDNEDFALQATCNDRHYALTKFNLTAGEYNFKVAAVYSEQAEDSALFVASDYSEPTDYVTVLSAPTITLNENGYVIEWTAVDSAEGYRVRSNSAEGTNTTYIYSDVITELNYDLSLSKVVPGGVNTLNVVQSVGDGSTTIDSIFSNEITFKKLATPQNVSGELTSSDVYTLTWDNVSGAKFIVNLNGELLAEVPSTTNEKVTCEVASNTFEIAGEYIIEVRAISVDDSIPSSSFSDPYTITKFDTPKELKVENNILTWENYEGAVYHVEIYLAETDERVYSSEELTETGLDLREYITAGNYYINITIVGNDKEYLTSEVSKLEGISRLTIPASLVLDKDIEGIKWTAVENATGYIVQIYNEDKSSEFEFEALTNGYTIDSKVGAGDWKVVIYAKGDNSNIVDSALSSELAFTKLEAATACTHYDSLFKFNKVGENNKYRFEFTLGSDVSSAEFNYSEDGYKHTFGDAGVYLIKLYTVGDYINTVTSNALVLDSVTKLAKPTDLLVRNNAFTWSAVENAIDYKVEIKPENGNAQHVNTDNNTVYSLLTLAGGKYTLKVQAIANLKEYVSSDYIEYDKQIIKLAAPANVKINSEKKVVWDAVQNAVTYKVLFINKENDKNVVTLNTEDASTSIAIPDTLLAGDWFIEVTALGNGLEIVDSDGSYRFTITKLATPSKLSHKSEVLTYTLLEGVANYEIYITLNGEYKTTLTVTNQSTFTSYDFEDVGEYKLTIRALGDYVSIINSDASEEITVRRLDTPKGINISESILRWDENTYVKENDFEYEINIKYENTINNIYKTKETQIGFEFSAIKNGSYVVYLRCLAGEEVDYLPSKLVNTDEIKKLHTPEITVGLINNKIVWTIASTTGVTGYIVSITKGENESTYTLVGSDNRSFELDERFEAGEYTIKVRAIGDGKTYIMSDYSTPSSYKKLEVVQFIIEPLNSTSTSPYVIAWEALQGATSYVIRFDNDENLEYTTSNNYFNLDLITTLEAGSHTFQIRAIGDTTYYTNSNLSNQSTIIRADSEDANLRIQNGVITWNSINGVELYELSINGAIVNCATNNTYVLDSTYNSGEYDISIKLYVNRNTGTTNVKINSLFSSEINAYKLPTPSEAQILNGEVKLSYVEYKYHPDTNMDEIDESLITRNYELEYGNYNEVKSYIEAEIQEGTIVYELYSGTPDVAQAIRYRAIGDNYNITSDWSDTDVETFGTQLKQPHTFKVENGVLYWSEIDGASKYLLQTIITIKKDNTEPDPSSDGEDEFEDVEYTILTTHTSYELPFNDIVESGIITITIKAIGDSTYTNSYMSDESIVITYLPQPNELSVRDGKLVWDNNGETGYQIVLNSTSFVELPGENNYYLFTSEDAGKYVVQVKGLGDDGVLINSILSDEYTVYKIDTPTKETGTFIYNASNDNWAYSTTAKASESFLNDGYVVWSTNSAFDNEVTNLNEQHPLSHLRVDLLPTNIEGDDNQNNVTSIQKDFFRLKDDNTFITYERNGAYHTLLNNYFDNIPSGYYKVKLTNIGTTEITANTPTGYITSKTSMEFDTCILPKPENVRVENGILKWNNVEGNNGYYIFIASAKNKDLTKVIIDKCDITSACVYDLNDYAPDVYTIYIRTKGDNIQYMNSAKSEEVITTVLSSPVSPKNDGLAFSIYNGKLSWLPVHGAIGYSVYVKSRGESGRDETFEDVLYEEIDGNIVYELSYALVAGDYDVQILSIGDGSQFITSKYSAVQIVTKLTTPINVENLDGKLKWNLSSYANGNKVMHYLVELYDGVEVISLPLEINNNERCFISENKEYVTYELPYDVPAGTYTITVKTMGSIQREGNTDKYYVNSTPCQEFEAVKLNAPTQIFVNNGIIKWNYNDVTAHQGFYLVINETVLADRLITEQQSEFPDEYPEGRHYVNVITVGNTVAYNDTATRYLSSSPNNQNTEVYKLSSVADFYIEDGILNWTAVADASKYEITTRYVQSTTSAGDDIIKEYVTTVDADSYLNNYTFELIGLDGEVPIYSSGLYRDIKVRPIGDNRRFVNGQNKKLDNIYKVSTPLQVQTKIETTDIGDVTYLTWQAVSYVNSYMYDDKEVKETIVISKYLLNLTSNGLVTQIVVEYSNILGYGQLEAENLDPNTNNLLPSSILRYNFGDTIKGGVYTVEVQAIPLPTQRQVGVEDGQKVYVTECKALRSDYSESVSIVKPDAPSSLIFDTSLMAYTWKAPIVNEGLSVTYEVLYIYRTTIDSKTFTIEKEYVNETVYYPTKLGYYKLIVRARVSGSMQSNYVGKSDAEPMFKFYYLEDIDKIDQSSTNFDKLTMEQNGSKIEYKFNGQLINIEGFYDTVDCTHNLFSGGDGSEANPYQITSPEELYSMNYYYRSNVYFKQMNNIDMDDRVIAGDTSIITIGSVSKPFSGVYNGNGLSISHVKYAPVAHKKGYNMGLFAYTNGAVIRNLTIKDSSMEINATNAVNAGLIVGYGEDTKLELCKAIYSTINITYQGTSSLTYYVGGLIGYATNLNSTIYRCTNYAVIQNTSNNSSLIVYAGGLAGAFYSDDNITSGINESGNYAQLQGTIVGGLIGDARTSIRQSFNIGDISAVNANNQFASAGGLIGKFEVESSNDYSYTIKSLYNAGNVSAVSTSTRECYAGGLFGFASIASSIWGDRNLYINYCYVSGSVVANKVGESEQKQNNGWVSGYALNLYVNSCYTTNGLTKVTGTDKGYSGTITNANQTMVNLMSNVNGLLGDDFEYREGYSRVTLVIERQLV